MSKKNFKVYFNVNGLKESKFGDIPGLEAAMQQELVRCYNMYANKTNNGVTDMLNKEFTELNPTYFKDTKGLEWYERVEYNKFMADGYMREVVDDMNEKSISPILNFYIDPEEVVFKGYLKQDRNVTIDFYMKAVY